MVCAQAMDRLGLPRANILAYTMPGFATSERTLSQAHKLMTATGCTAQQIDIRPSCLQMLEDLAHPHTEAVPKYDITFENVQAGERTSHLFRLANLHNGIVVGTGDLSELALGWCTYGVGDHMSHYNVNASVPKTLIKHLVRWVADTGQIGADGSDVLRAILDTEVSPELIPSTPGADQPSQRTEDTIGPYELQDFHLYYTLRYGFRPTKVAFSRLHGVARPRTRGAWPDDAHALVLQRVRAGGDQAPPRHLPVAFLQDQPVQALLRAERAEGRLGRLAVAARRLARAQRFGGRGVAGRAARRAGLGRRGGRGRLTSPVIWPRPARHCAAAANARWAMDATVCVCPVPSAQRSALSCRLQGSSPAARRVEVLPHRRADGAGGNAVGALPAP